MHGSIISSACPAPFQAVPFTLVEILSFFANNYCDLVANRGDAEKLARACDCAGTSICQLVARLPDFASDPSVSQLHKLLNEAHKYVKSTLTPPLRGNKQWILMLKSAASVRTVRRTLEAYKYDIYKQLNLALLAESCRKIVQEELARLETMRQQIHSLLSTGTSPASAIVDRKADKLKDIVLAARLRKKEMQQDIELGNMTLEQAEANKVYQTVDQLCQEATMVAEKFKRPLSFEDWMVDSDAVAYNDCYWYSDEGHKVDDKVGPPGAAL
ncbi:hypothetical protein HK405_002997 [Cladochytrium tenue]|nr:hypothetical protein HK405_002997 [Cladochytrium tenue]